MIMCLGEKMALKKTKGGEKKDRITKARLSGFKCNA